MRIMYGDRGTWNGDFVQKLKISRKSNHNIKKFNIHGQF